MVSQSLYEIKCRLQQIVKSAAASKFMLFHAGSQTKEFTWLRYLISLNIDIHCLNLLGDFKKVAHTTQIKGFH